MERESMVWLRRAALAVFCASLSLAARAEPPPVSAFTAFAKFDDVVISPKGTRLALTQRVGEKHQLMLVKFPSLEVERTISYGGWVDIDGIQWVNDDVLLFEPARLFPGLIAYKAPTGEIVRVQASTGQSELIFGFLAGKQQTGTRVPMRDSTYAVGELLSVHAPNPAEVLIQARGGRNDTSVAYRMNIQSGLLFKVAGAPVVNGRFVLGADQQPELVYGTNVANDLIVWQRGEGLSWVERLSGNNKVGGVVPLAWTGKGAEFYVLEDRDAPTQGVALWDAAAGSLRLLYRRPSADLQPLGTDANDRIWGFTTVDLYPQYWYPDPEHPLAKMHRALVKLFPQFVVEVVSQTDDMKLATVSISSAESPPAFLLVETATAKMLKLIATYPDLKPESMAPVDAIEFRARDGLAIHGYLTTPKAADGKPVKNSPMIVMIHGGPHGIADTNSWNFERQLFASRGYVVLQVNYRGSGGRGREFERAGYGKWGREMQDDVTDAVRWAIGDGVADPKRICIYGGSYGAYSALTGAFREPSMFKCAVGMSGVYDLALMFDKGDIPTYARGMNYLKDAVGEDKDELRARSPAHNARSITAKVLLLHGKEDPRTPLVQAERMRKALIDAGNPPEWSVESGEMHGIFNAKNRVEAWERILAFFDKNIG